MDLRSIINTDPPSTAQSSLPPLRQSPQSGGRLSRDSQQAGQGYLASPTSHHQPASSPLSSVLNQHDARSDRALSNVSLAKQSAQQQSPLFSVASNRHQLLQRTSLSPVQQHQPHPSLQRDTFNTPVPSSHPGFYAHSQHASSSHPLSATPIGPYGQPQAHYRHPSLQSLSPKSAPAQGHAHSSLLQSPVAISPNANPPSLPQNIHGSHPGTPLGPPLSYPRPPSYSQKDPSSPFSHHRSQSGLSYGAVPLTPASNSTPGQSFGSPRAYERQSATPISALVQREIGQERERSLSVSPKTQVTSRNHSNESVPAVREHGLRYAHTISMSPVLMENGESQTGRFSYPGSHSDILSSASLDKVDGQRQETRIDTLTERSELSYQKPLEQSFVGSEYRRDKSTTVGSEEEPLLKERDQKDLFTNKAPQISDSHILSSPPRVSKAEQSTDVPRPPLTESVTSGEIVESKAVESTRPTDREESSHSLEKDQPTSVMQSSQQTITPTMRDGLPSQHTNEEIKQPPASETPSVEAVVGGVSTGAKAAPSLKRHRTIPNWAKRARPGEIVSVRRSARKDLSMDPPGTYSGHFVPEMPNGSRIHGVVRGLQEPSITNERPSDEVSRDLSDFLQAYVVANDGWKSLNGVKLEIEAKVGMLVDTHTNERLALPVRTEAVLESSRNDVSFRSSITLEQHRAVNAFLNNAYKESQNGQRVPMRYQHTKERDTYYEFTENAFSYLPESARNIITPTPRTRIRATRDEAGNTMSMIVKHRVQDFDIYSPRTDFDYRISINLEFPYVGDVDELVEATERGAKKERLKDRVTYWHQDYRIDFTQAKHSDLPSDWSHELEIELDEEKLWIDGKNDKVKFDGYVEGLVNNLRVLGRAATEV